jgi:hypothetical protein
MNAITLVAPMALIAVKTVEKPGRKSITAIASA